jgi:SAM-dependent methyltransferase
MGRNKHMNQFGLPRKIHDKSLKHMVAFIKARITIRKILKTIDVEKFRIFQERYKDADSTPGGYSKYLDIFSWMMHKLTYFYLLDLHKMKPLRILDLGTGTGFFPYICSLYGHKVIALDVDTVPMYNDICKFLRIDRRIWRIVKFEKLPALGDRSDLVTAFMVTFNQHNRSDEWGVDEWRFLLNDLQCNQLVNGGRIFLNLNYRSDGTWCDDALLRLFLDFRGKIYLNHVDIGGSKRYLA